MDLIKLYNKLPIIVQNMACSFEGKRIQIQRYGSDFQNIFMDYKQRNNWSYEQMCDFRDKRLKLMIKHCYDTVPFYRNLFDDYGINPESIRDLEDLKKLPLLTKSIVKNNFNNLISTDINKNKVIKIKTSGTTGAGLTLYCTRETIYEQWSSFWRARNNIGIEFGAWNAIFGGKNVVSIEQQRPPYWRVNAAGHQVYFSVYHLNDSNIEDYISEIEKRRIKWIHAYPSAINLIAQYMVSHNRQLSSEIKYITTGSENLLESQKSVINQAFGIKPYQHYGQAENVAIFSERKDHKIFVDEDFSAVEFLYDPNLDTYKIVGTSLNNYAMPLLRYEIGDIADFRESNEGREILSLDGRKEDYIVLSNGTKVGRLADVFCHMTNIYESQIIQNKVGEIIIRIVKGCNYSYEDEKLLLNKLYLKIGKSEKIILEYVNEINRTKNGKLRFVISNVSKN